MNILLYINANKALVCINHNLLPQVKVCHCCDDLAAAMVLPNSLGEVIAVQIVVIVQLVQHIVTVFQAVDVHLNALDDFRTGEGSLPGKANDLLLAGTAGINVEQAAGDFPRDALQERQLEERQYSQRPCRADRDDEAAGEQIVQRVILGIAGADHNESTNQQALHTVLPAAVDGIGIVRHLLVVAADFFFPQDAPVEDGPDYKLLHIDLVFFLTDDNGRAGAFLGAAADITAVGSVKHFHKISSDNFSFYG
jgi:hypothetical protein